MLDVAHFSTCTSIAGRPWRGFTRASLNDLEIEGGKLGLDYERLLFVVRSSARANQTKPRCIWWNNPRAWEAKPLYVPEVNRALREAIRKIVMQPDQGLLWVFWHHAEAPSEPIVFRFPTDESAGVLNIPE